MSVRSRSDKAGAMEPLDQRLIRYLDGLRGEGRLREIRPCRPGDGGEIVRDGKRLLDFSSNDYLGLSRHPDVIGRARDWAAEWGAGARASRLVTGTFDLHERVEAKLAALKGAEAALVFNSGFQANSALLPTLLDKGMLGEEALVFTDRLIHASLHAGLAAAGVRQIRFRHNDLEHLEELLSSHDDRPGQRFILTESVFSMDGDRCDTVALADLAERFGAVLYLDEAHATGVLGPKGMGLSGEAPGRVGVIMGTFSKALGGFGAYVACSRAMRDYLVNRCAGLIYSTALPPAVLGAMDAALDLVPAMDAERARLHGNADRLRAALVAAGLDVGESATQIVPAIVGEAEAALAASRYLEGQGILGIAIRPPTVPKGASRIRFAVSAAHGEAEMDRLVAAIPGLAGL